MTRGASILILFAVAATAHVRAEPAPSRIATTPAPTSAHPVVTTPTPDAHLRRVHKLLAAGAVGLVHASYATWSYFAWYRDAKASDFHEEVGAAFGERTYAGGADKLGHFWANYVVTRGTTRLLVDAGWDPLGSTLVAAGLTEISFLLTELEDGYTVGFDRDDLVANLAGAGFAIAMERLPQLDRYLDFRLEYVPSRDYRRHASLDIAQDYSGQSYLLALHLGELPRLDAARYVDLVTGFQTRSYSPSPPDGTERTRELYVGLAVNLQAVIERLVCPCTGRKLATGVFEVYSPPFTTAKLPVATSGFVP